MYSILFLSKNSKKCRNILENNPKKCTSERPPVCISLPVSTFLYLVLLLKQGEPTWKPNPHPLKHSASPSPKTSSFNTTLEKIKKSLSHSLHSFLPLKKETSISDVVHLNPRLLSSDAFLKQSILDLKLRLNTGDYVNIEMQTFPESAFSERLLYYLCRMYVDEQNLRKGKKYEELSRCYSLVFTNFSLNKKLKDVCSSFSFRQDKPPHVVYSDRLRIIVVDLSGFREEDKSLDLDRRQFVWCSLLKGSQRGFN